MKNAPIDSEVAFRIALAAREIKLDVPLFVSALIKTIGYPVTLQRLKKVRVSRLARSIERIPKTIIEHNQFDMEGWKGEFDPEDLKGCVDLLKGRGLPLIAAPRWHIQPYAEGDIPNSIRIACTCIQPNMLDAQFHNCKYFLIYQVSAKDMRLIDVRHAKQATHTNQAKGAGSQTTLSRDDRLSYNAKLISDCVLLYTCNIGHNASAKVVKAGVLPIKTKAPTPVIQVIETQQTVLTNPPRWLKKAMQHPSTQIAFTDDEAHDKSIQAPISDRIGVQNEHRSKQTQPIRH